MQFREPAAQNWTSTQLEPRSLVKRPGLCRATTRSQNDWISHRLSAKLPDPVASTTPSGLPAWGSRSAPRFCS